MFSFIKPIIAVLLLAALIPLAAQVRPRDLGPTGPAIHATQSHNNGAFVTNHDASRLHYADNAASFQSRGTVGNDAYALNEVSVYPRVIADGVSDSVII